MTILGIETSCDETGAAVLRGSSLNAPITILSNKIVTSLDLHATTGGIIPENAAREQLKYILPVIDQALMELNPRSDIDAIAVTVGPGLIGSLLVGVETAKTLAYLWNKPVIPVNHLYGHIYANWIQTQEIRFPAIALIVSGGHTDIVFLKDHNDVRVIGSTRDDAAGEAFDKIGRLLHLQYPAGPKISQLAEKGNPKAFPFPRPMKTSGDFDFSFSGLKTSVLNLVKSNTWNFSDDMFLQKNRGLMEDICASVEEAIVDVLVYKTIRAAHQTSAKSILLGGGVAANQKLRERLDEESGKNGFTFCAPKREYCTDNAAMIASAGFFRYNPLPWQELTADPELYY